MARESTFWAWIRNGSPAEAHLERVENACKTGTPDLNGCVIAHDFWCELKACDRPPRRSTKLPCLREDKLKLEQCLWLARRRDAGGRAWLCVRVGSGHRASVYLIDGHDAEACIGGNEETLERLRVLPSSTLARRLVLAMAGLEPTGHAVR
jgi:hypothetical protein